MCYKESRSAKHEFLGAECEVVCFCSHAAVNQMTTEASPYFDDETRKIHYRVHIKLPPDICLSQCLMLRFFVIIFPSTPKTKRSDAFTVCSMRAPVTSSFSLLLFGEDYTVR